MSKTRDVEVKHAFANERGPHPLHLYERRSLRVLSENVSDEKDDACSIPENKHRRDLVKTNDWLILHLVSQSKYFKERVFA